MVETRCSTRKIAWWAIGLALAGAFLYALYQYVGVVVLSVFIYYATRPIHRKVSRIIPFRTVSVIVSLAVFTLPALILIGYTANVVLLELNAVLQSHDLSYLESFVQPYLSTELLQIDWKLLLQSPSEFLAANGGVTLAKSFYDYTLSYISLFGSLLINLILTLIIAFYLLRDDARLGRWFRSNFGTHLPHWQVFMDEVDTDLQSVFFGNILNALITAFIGVIVFTTLSFFAPPGLVAPYPALVGMLCGVFSLVPLVGTKIAYLPYAGYLTLQSVTNDTSGTLWFPIGLVIIAYAVVDTIPDIVLRPYVSGRRIHIGQLMLTYIIAPMLFGWYGLFLGPIILVMGLHFTTEVLPYLLEPRITTAETDGGNRRLTDYAED